ncbi:MAG: amidohydrolase family protein [Thermoanaerobaculia bacterium]
MIIDCHVHLNRYYDTESASLGERLRKLKEEMLVAGIDYALVLSSYTTNDRRPSVHEVLEAVGDDPTIGIVAGVSYDTYKAHDLADYRSLLSAKRIRGFKIYPGYEPFYPSDRRMRVIYELAGEFGVPVMIHCGDTFTPTGKVKFAHPLEVDEVAVDFRNVTFVICHLGSPWVTDAMEVIYKNPNVVGDISGLTLGEFEERFERFMLEEVNDVVAYAGDPTKLLFGSDWPISDMRSYIRFVRQLDIRDDEKEMILWRNTSRVFGLGFEETAPEADEGPIVVQGEDVLDIVDVTDERTPLAARSLELLGASFDVHERHSFEDFKSELAEKRLDLLKPFDFHMLCAIDRNGDAHGTCAGVYLAGVNAGFVLYLAVAESGRGSGLGHLLREQLVRRFRQNAKDAGFGNLNCIFGEVRIDNPWLARLVRDGKILPLDFRYFHPAAGVESVDRYVLYREPISDRREAIPAAEVKQALYAIFRRAYRVRYPYERENFRAMLEEIGTREEIGASPEVLALAEAGTTEGEA